MYNARFDSTISKWRMELCKYIQAKTVCTFFSSLFIASFDVYLLLLGYHKVSCYMFSYHLVSICLFFCLAKEKLFPVADATTFFTDLHHILRVIAAGNIRTLCHHRLVLLEQVYILS